MNKLFMYIVLLFIITGCTQKYSVVKEAQEAKPETMKFEDISGFKEDDLDLALEVFKKDCKRSKRYELFKEVCEKAKNADDAYTFFTKNFTPFKLKNSKGEDKGVITGYYEPLLYGSYKKSEKYKYPIFKTPKDLIKVKLSEIYPDLKKRKLVGKVENRSLVPYTKREDIKENKNLEAICYVDNKVDAYFLEIQGSGKVQFPNKKILNIGYAAQNGQKYVSIGKYMIKKGYIGKKTGYTGSIQGMKKWFNDNPKLVDEVLNQNPSYIFFEKREQGATGSLGTVLTKKRNLAVDRKYIKLGMPVFINTKNPVTKKNIDRLMIAADTGGAIKGEIRADFFWGYSKEAEKYAGRMKEKGSLIILVPNSNKVKE